MLFRAKSKLKLNITLSRHLARFGTGRPTPLYFGSTNEEAAPRRRTRDRHDRSNQPPIRFDNSYATLPERFLRAGAPRFPVAQPSLIRLNDKLAEELGIDTAWLGKARTASTCWRAIGLPGNADPIAQAYAGHQFGNFVPQLGDGVGESTLGRIGPARAGGSVGPPPGRVAHTTWVRPTTFPAQCPSARWSTAGGGRPRYPAEGIGAHGLFARAATDVRRSGPLLREYVVSEAMARMGVATTNYRTLAAVKSGEPVLRDTVLPGGVLTARRLQPCPGRHLPVFRRCAATRMR